MAKSIREVYRTYITEGGYALTRLLYSVATESIYSSDINNDNNVAEDIIQIATELVGKKSVERQFHKKIKYQHQKLFELYDALQDLMDKLRTKEVRESKYTAFYPEFLTETYGKLQPMEKGFDAEHDGNGINVDGNYRTREIRKRVLERFLNLVEENKRNNYVDFDFESKETIRILNDIEYIRQTAVKKQHINLTKKLYRSKILNYKQLTAGRDLKELTQVLADETTVPLDLYRVWLADEDVKVTIENDVLTCKFRKLRCVSSYTLHINGIRIYTTYRDNIMSVPLYARADLLPIKEDSIKVLAERSETDILLLEKAFRETTSNTYRSNFLLSLLDDRTNALSSYGMIIFLSSTLNAIRRNMPYAYSMIHKYLIMHKYNNQSAESYLWIPTALRLMQSRNPERYDKSLAMRMKEYCELTRICYGNEACKRCSARKTCDAYFGDKHMSEEWIKGYDAKKHIEEKLKAMIDKLAPPDIGEDEELYREYKELMQQQLWRTLTPQVREALLYTTKETFNEANDKFI